MSEEVVVTGIGVVCAAGAGKKLFWEAISQGSSQITPIDRFDTAGYRCRIGAQIPQSFDPGPLNTSPTVWDLTSSVALVAAREAVEESGREVEGVEVGLYWGSAVGGIISLDEQFKNFYTRGPRWVVPATVPRTMLNSPAALLAIEQQMRGPNCTFSSACSASSQAILHAVHEIQAGRLTACLVGGSDCPLAPGHLQAWDQLRALSPDNETPGRACRPFSRNRKGLVLGEGAVALVLERGRDAERRGIEPYARIRCGAANCDASSLLEPSASSQQKCLELALQRSGWKNSLPDYIAAHGTGTSAGDRTEVKALTDTFGERSEELVISSIKSILGHTLGASGALSLASVMLAAQSELAPPTANFEEADPECSIDCIPNTPRPLRITKALVNSFAFGGSNVVIAVERT